jgi:hypothetical protein
MTPKEKLQNLIGKTLEDARHARMPMHLLTEQTQHNKLRVRRHPFAMQQHDKSKHQQMHMTTREQLKQLDYKSKHKT